MNQQTVTMLVVIGAAMVVLVLIGITFALNRRSRLRPLPPESVDRYARSWQQVEAQFIEDPRAAVQEADRVVVMMLGERGAKMDDERRVPDDLKQARAAGSSDEGREGTEGMRKAMLQYKHLVDDAIGASKKPQETGRREVAS